MNLQEVYKNARERMKSYCRVCPVCDGRACSGEVPGMGGLGSGESFRTNVQDLASIKLNMRLVHGVKKPNTETTFFGFNISFPVMASPIGGSEYNMGGYLTEQAYGKAVASGCCKAGTIACSGDGAPNMIFEYGLEGIQNEKSRGIPFIKPWDGDELDRKMKLAADAGCKAIGMDIDAAGLITLSLMGRPVSPKTTDELAKIVDKAHKLGLRFIIKGLMNYEDSKSAVDAGCDAILISNHGGRVLDHTIGTARVLAQYGDKLRTLNVPILVDGGVRSGTDVLKMLALGADIVLLGRPITIAAVGGEEEGVSLILNKIHNELIQTMLLTGCQDLESIKTQKNDVIIMPNSFS